MSSNQNITQKSLEKLSSGLRINRAGDDAAGLAISEKMRAQIRGLDQAARNAQDGISMIQTAEGALNEVHAILQRMRELANQAANDTNVDVDRNEIQKEINQLTSEINRIGNTTEFNTQKLLNGGKQIDANVTVSAKTLIGGLDAGNVNASATETSLGEDAVQGVGFSGNITVSTADANDAAIAIGNITVNITFNDLADVHNASNITNINGAAGTVDLVIDRTKDAANAATAIAAALQEVVNAANYTGPLAGATFVAEGEQVKVTLGADVDETTANALKFDLTQGSATAFAIVNNGQSIGAQVGASVPGAVLDNDAVAASGNIRFNTGDGVPAEGTNIVIANKVIAFYDSSSGNYDDAEHAKSALSADYVVDIYGITDGAGIAQAVVNAINTEPISGYQIKVNDTNADQVDITATTAAASGLSANQLAAVNDNAAPTAATGSITFTSVPTEGASITIGDSTIGFYDSNSGTYADANAAKEALGTDYVIDINGKTTVNQIKDAILALDPQISQVTMADGGVGKIDITAAVAGAAGNQISLAGTNDETSGFEAKFQIGANYAQSMTIDINDMRAAALGVSSTTEGGEVIAKDGAKANYIAIEAKVTNGTDNDGIEYALDVSTHDKATAAISVINDAIEAVSAERSKLGAFQNRLEHTINNLGTSSENLTAAESRIRDVDMAKEMMEFTKMNILSQAAQAMLAQANQVPQGVLQLLR